MREIVRLSGEEKSWKEKKMKERNYRLKSCGVPL
jgi:hypothetical protein